MKKLEELGISPTPWKVRLLDWGKDRVDSIDDANGEIIVETDYGVYLHKLPDARMLAAAPKLYAALYKLLGDACQHCDLRGACQAACNAVQNARDALAEASGEAKPVGYQPNSGGFLVRAAGEVIGKGEVPNA